MLQKKRSVVQVREERDIEGENTREQEKEAIVVGHEREEVRGEGDGQNQEERPGTATGRHRRSGWDPNWVDISRFKPWLYHVQSHGNYST